MGITSPAVSTGAALPEGAKGETACWVNAAPWFSSAPSLVLNKVVPNPGWACGWEKPNGLLFMGVPGAGVVGASATAEAPEGEKGEKLPSSLSEEPLLPLLKRLRMENAIWGGNLDEMSVRMLAVNAVNNLAY
jgi:hypothetical protein